MEWLSMKSAPTDGTKFIALLDSGLVFRCKRQAYHTYMSEDEQKEYGHKGFHPTRMRHGWAYEDADSFNECWPVGFIPLPAPPKQEG